MKKFSRIYRIVGYTEFGRKKYNRNRIGEKKPQIFFSLLVFKEINFILTKQKENEIEMVGRNIFFLVIKQSIIVIRFISKRKTTTTTKTSYPIIYLIQKKKKNESNRLVYHRIICFNILIVVEYETISFYK